MQKLLAPSPAGFGRNENCSSTYHFHLVWSAGKISPAPPVSLAVAFTQPFQVLRPCLPFTVHHYVETDELTWNNRVAFLVVLWSCLRDSSSPDVYIPPPALELVQIAILSPVPDISYENQEGQYGKK